MPNDNNTPSWESPTLERVFNFLNSEAGQLVTYQLTPIENAPHVQSLPEMKGLTLTERATYCQERRGWIEVKGKKLECF